MSKREQAMCAMRTELARLGILAESHVIRPAKLIMPVLAWTDQGGDDVRVIWNKRKVVLTFRNTSCLFAWNGFPGVEVVLDACNLLRACEALDLMPVE